MTGVEIVVIGAGAVSAVEALQAISIAVHQNTLIENVSEETYSKFFPYTSYNSPLGIAVLAIIPEEVLGGTKLRSRKSELPHHPVAGQSSGPALCSFCKLRSSLHPP